jgi:hypothetical protein
VPWSATSTITSSGAATRETGAQLALQVQLPEYSNVKKPVHFSLLPRP